MEQNYNKQHDRWERQYEYSVKKDDGVNIKKNKNTNMKVNISRHIKKRGYKDT